MKKKLFIFFIIIILAVSLIACNNGGEKQSLANLDLNFKTAKNKTVETKMDITLSYFSFQLNKQPKRVNMTQHAELNRIFSENAFYLNGKVYSGKIDSGFKNLINTVLKFMEERSPEAVAMIKNYLYNGSFLSFELGMKDGYINAKGDITEKDGIPDFKFPIDDNKFLSLFFGLSESDIYKFLNDMELPLDLDINIANILNFNDPFAMDWSGIKDTGSKRYNSREDAYMHKYAITGDAIKNMLVKTLDESVAEAVKNDPSLEEFKIYYEKYKTVVMNWFKFGDVVLNAKSDKDGKLIEKNISYNLDFTLNVKDLDVFLEDFPEISEIISMLPLMQALFTSSDGNKDKITFLVGMNYTEKYNFSSQIDLTNNIFSGGADLENRTYLEYVEYVDKDGKTAWKWQKKES